MNEYAVSIPNDNGYSSQPNMVTRRVLPHIQEKDSSATPTHNVGGSWNLKASPEKAFFVTGTLRTHYGFEVTLHA